MSETEIIAERLQEELPKTELVQNDNWWMSMVPMLLIFLVFYFLLIRPQEKKRKEQETMVDSIKKGDSVVLSSGIYGKVIKLYDNDTIDLEISKDTKVKVMKSSISNKIEK